jgi:hypothetical protein
MVQADVDTDGAVTVDGRAPLGRGRDQPRVVYSADFGDLFRDLKRGYLARLAKKWANAVCKCRKHC